MNLDQLEQLQRSKTKEAGGHWQVNEGDWWQNKISRAKIRVYTRMHGGTCYLGQVNRYNRDEPYRLRRYTYGMVYNFECSFAVPREDGQLLGLLSARESVVYTGATDDYKRLTAIFERIEQLGGISLRWV